MEAPRLEARGLTAGSADAPAPNGAHTRAPPVAEAVTRRDRLRAATGPQHRAVDAVVGDAAFFGSPEGYVRWLGGMAAFHDALVHALGTVSIACVGPLSDGLTLPTGSLKKRATLLAQDLSDLAGHLPSTHLPSTHVTSALSIPDDADPLNLGSAAAAFGALYVAEGASLGARVLLIRAQKLGFHADHGARHLAFAAHDWAHWHAFLRQLETLSCDADGESRMIAGAQQTFVLAARCLSHARQPAPTPTLGA